MDKLPVLISFAYASCFDWNKVKAMKNDIDLLIDCGAFTEFKKGKRVSMQRYLDFITEHEPDEYFMLDAIGDPEKTFQQYHEMKNAGFKPIPIFTRGDSLDRLEQYYEESSNVALGGLKVGGKNDLGYLKYIMNKGIKGRKTHWLGFADHDYMLYYKPYSVDAINWKRALLYGELVIHTRLGVKKARRTDFASSMPPLAREIQRMGFDPYLLKKEESWRGVCTYAHEISTVSYLRYIRRLKEMIGVKFYLVCNAQHEIDFLLKLHLREETYK